MKRWAVVGALALAGCTSVSPLSDPREISVEIGATPAGAVLSHDMKGLVEQTGPTYVTLIVTEAQKQRGRLGDMLPDAVTSGSGFVIDEAGYVLTAGHVAVANDYMVDARGADGRLYQGKVVDVRPSYDMALIKLSGFKGKPVEPAASPCMMPGEPVFSLGKPHAQGDIARIGEVAAMSFGRAVSYDGFGYPDAVVLRMDTKKGESGGPVFNSKGELTAMLVSTLSDGNGHPLNLAHALPSPMLAQFICAHINCSQKWRSLASANTSECRGQAFVKRPAIEAN